MQEDEQKHTTLPWRISYSPNGFPTYIENGGGRTVASIYGQYRSLEEAEANAQRIVQSVNGYRAMIGALVWIAQSPHAHPANMVAVARDALEKIGVGYEQV